MSSVGIIAEYDPFHRGHARHIEKAKEYSGCDTVISVMSGSFTQRGMPSMFSPRARAEAAVLAGADICLLLPTAFAVREAENFALGGVYLLSKAGATHLSFGCETPEPALLLSAAKILENEPEPFRVTMKEALGSGLSHARARGEALKKLLGTDAETLSLPNNTLAVCYLRAILRLSSPLIPVPVLREGDYHSLSLEQAYPSAAALRRAAGDGDISALETGIPECCRKVLTDEAAGGLLCKEDSTDSILMYLLDGMKPEELAACPECGEGLEKRVLNALHQAHGREELIALVKTKRYTYSRISRLLCHALLGITRNSLPPLPVYTRVLACRESALPLLRDITDRFGNEIETVSRPAKAVSACFEQEMRADRLRLILTKQSTGSAYSEYNPVIRGI